LFHKVYDYSIAPIVRNVNFISSSDHALTGDADWLRNEFNRAVSNQLNNSRCEPGNALARQLGNRS